MPHFLSKSQSEQILSSTQAAGILNMSTSTLKTLADKSIIPSWKTMGGHRRFDLQTVLNIKEEMTAGARANPLSSVGKSSVMVVSKLNPSDPDLKIHNDLANFYDISFEESLSEAYMKFYKKIPAIILVELENSIVQQLENMQFLDVLVKNNESNRIVVCLSNSKNLAMGMKSQISGKIKIVNGSLTGHWLTGFLMGILYHRKGVGL